MLTFGTKSHHLVTLVPFFSDSKERPKDDFLNLEPFSCTFISEKKLLYCSLGKRKEYNPHHLKPLMVCLIQQKRFDLNISPADFATSKRSETNISRDWIATYYLVRHAPKTYKKKPAKISTKKLHFVSTTLSLGTFKEWNQELQSTMTAVNLARDWQDAAPNHLNAVTFANEVKTLFQKFPQVKCEILDRKMILAEQMNLLLSVNAGSTIEPRVVVLKYLNNPGGKTTALVGKGITFDSGGYSLKPSRYQIDMKFDMSGAAIVCATMKAIAEQKLPINVVAIACLTDNRIGATATLVESVIRSKNGKTVEITNTDAEGRLVLADGITYAIRQCKVQEIIELSTLTGAITITFDNHTTGAFTTAPKLLKKFADAAKTTGENLWELPVRLENFEAMRASVIADLQNSAVQYQGGASNAAAFLMEFTEKKPFLHLDIAGTATTKKHRGTGVMVRTLMRFFHNASGKIISHKN